MILEYIIEQFNYIHTTFTSCINQGEYISAFFLFILSALFIIVSVIVIDYFLLLISALCKNYIKPVYNKIFRK